MLTKSNPKLCTIYDVGAQEPHKDPEHKLQRVCKHTHAFVTHLYARVGNVTGDLK